MIAASEPQEFVPFGRQQMKRHPGTVTFTLKEFGDQPECLLAQKLSKVNINDYPQDERWILTDSTVSTKENEDPRTTRGLAKEKELYVSGKTAVVSTGSVGVSVALGFVDKSSCRVLEASYTVENPIQHALFSCFLDHESNPMPSLCLVESERINVFCDSGEEFTTPLQFKVASAWSTKYGLLLERVTHTHPDRSNDSSCSCDDLTTIFSLVHPLDEISPLLCIKSGGALTYMNDAAYKVIYTCEDPSICLLFNSKTGLHSIWNIRWAEQEECEGMCGLSSSSVLRTTSQYVRPSTSFKLTPVENKSTFLDPNFSVNSPLLNLSTELGLNQSEGSPFTSQLQKSHYSSVNSPRVRQINASRVHSASSEARLGLSVSSQQAEPKPIVPELCLEYLWTEFSSSTISKFLPASKAFITTDFLGQQFLCYLIGGTTLAMVKLGRTNSPNPGMIAGSIYSIKAKDAVPVPALNLLAVLETGGWIVLYSGTLIVGKLHIGGVSAERATVSYLSALSSVSRINSPFPPTHTPGRPCVMSSTRIGDAAFDDSLNLLSPVPRQLDGESDQATPSSCLSSPDGVNLGGLGLSSDQDTVKRLRDPVGTKFTLEFSNGSLFRLNMPEFCSSPLVTSCVKVLKRVLQRDVALMVMAKWYTTRNAPGTQDISSRQEWQLFISTILSLIGYDINSLPLMTFYINSDCDTSIRVKKMKSCDTGSNDDWEFMCNKSFERFMPDHVKNAVGCHRFQLAAKEQISGDTIKDKVAFNKESPLFSYMYSILLPLHLLYEDMKLNPIIKDTWMLAQFLHQLSTDLRLPKFAHHYWVDFPVECTFESSIESQLSEDDLQNLDVPPYMSVEPSSLFDVILRLCTNDEVRNLYPYIDGINDKSKKILQVFGTLAGRKMEEIVKNALPNSSTGLTDCNVGESACLSPSRAHQTVLLMANLGISRDDLLNLPFGVALILSSAIQTVAESPCQGWPLEVCQLICRLDLLPDTTKNVSDERVAINRFLNNESSDDSCAKISEAILKMRFNKDQRVQEVIRLLKSSEPVVIAITQRPEVNDHEFIEEQERHLYAICTRTMALPVGRGMMDLHTAISVVITEQLEIPKLCLTGKAPPRGTTVELAHIEVVPNMNLWPLFHNGVAAGLQISPHSKNIDSTWILYNKAKSGSDFVPEHAGFLMALGLSGHLSDLMQLHLYNYLNKCHEMTSVGVLLGLAASKRGTMDNLATKIFSLHIESLLPPTSIELDLVQNTQVAAMLGIGLIYQGTGHRHIAEALLSEIGRPPGPEMENSCDREGYSLAAGLGLGLVMLNKGSDPVGLADHDIADTLYHYMVGGHRRPLTGSQKEKYKNPSYQIREGECVNYHVTGPGATLALGMMYFNSKNVAVASWLKAPDSEYMMDFVCPHQLMLRAIAHGLVLWDRIIPSRDWVEGHVPSTIRPYCLCRPRAGLENVDLETMNQAYCNIVAGACMVLGLRFAGTNNSQAFDTLYYYCKMFISLASKSIAELAGKSTIETCICVTLLALATTMAGSGDLDVLRICRYLGSRVGQATNSVVTYGSHLAVHMALGLLFLGGGALSLSNSPESVAAMLCAFFPRFPTHSNDNRYHLQAFRHLYVLAVEPRLFLPKDITNGSLCYTHLSLEFRKTPYYDRTSITVFAPCILPHLDLLQEVRVEDDRYWPISFSRGSNWHILEETLKKGSTVGIELRAGRLPYVEDPRGFKTLLAQTLSEDAIVPWTVSTPTILAFLANKNTINFAKTFLVQLSDCKRSKKLVQWLSNVAYECITRNKLPLLEYWTLALTEMMKLERSPSTALITQLKLIVACKNFFLHSERVAAISQFVTAVLESWETSHQQLLRDYITGTVIDELSGTDATMLATYLTYWNIPSPDELQFLSDGSSQNFLEVVHKSKQARLRINLNVVRFLWSLAASGNGRPTDQSSSNRVAAVATGMDDS